MFTQFLTSAVSASASLGAMSPFMSPLLNGSYICWGQATCLNCPLQTNTFEDLPLPFELIALSSMSWSTLIVLATSSIVGMFSFK